MGQLAYKRDLLKRRGVYLLPNLLTTSTLFFGCYAILSAVDGQFEGASIAILIAVVSDFLDGWVARLTHTQTPFGQEYDSLADMVAFGVAPAGLFYQWSLYEYKTTGAVIAFLYVAATALRLARFNAQIAQVDKHYFKGVPCTIAAALLASVIWLETTNQMTSGRGVWLHACLIFVVSALQVSNVSYLSSKILSLKGKTSIFMAIIAIFILALVVVYPPLILTLIFALYVLSGVGLSLYKWYGGSLKTFSWQSSARE